MTLARRTVLVLSACAVVWFGVPSAKADALEDIQKAGTVRIGIFPDFPPFSSASADMSLRGYDVDMAEIIGKALNAKPQLVSVTGQNRIPMLVDRRVDILLSVGWSAERAKVIDYTAAYAPYYVAVIGPASIKVTGKDDLAGKTIAVNRGTLEDTTLTEIAPPAADIRRFDNYNSVLQAFLSQQTQLIAVGNDVGAQIFARRADLKPEQKFQLRISPTHIGMNKNEERLKAKLDEVVNRLMADGTLDGLSQKWLGKPLDPKDLKSAAAL